MFYCRYSYDWGEVMNSFDSMKTKLESTGLYKVTAKSNIRAELLVYAEGLNTEFDMLETMERELFIDTAEMQSTACWNFASLPSSNTVLPEEPITISPFLIIVSLILHRLAVDKNSAVIFQHNTRSAL